MTSTSPPAPACTIVIFGGAGDLTQRLLMPSLYDLAVSRLLDPATTILGCDHTDLDAASWRSTLGDALHRFAAEPGSEFHGTVDDVSWSFIADRLAYQRFDFGHEDDYATLAQRLAGTGNVLFYLAVAPWFFEPIVAGIAKAGLLAEHDGAFRRVIIEKPFGRDLASARELNANLTAIAAETQLYRIDHFLGKEAVQGITSLRFANRAFDALLHRDAVASVQITAAETVGVEERGAFYEDTGALRDMVPNHLFSLLTQVAMDEPASFDAAGIRDAKSALLHAMESIAPANAVRGQYAAGMLNGQNVVGYRDEHKVANDSRTETYVALAARIGNDRWRDVPFYIRTGKRMGAHVTTVTIALKPRRVAAPSPELLQFTIDPHGGLVHRFAAKSPGVDEQLAMAVMGFHYDQTFADLPNVGYETLLYHAMRGDATLFQRDDMIEAEWAAVEPVLDAWRNATDAPPAYPAGSTGPAEADALTARNGDRWLDIAPLASP